MRRLKSQKKRSVWSEWLLNRISSYVSIYMLRTDITANQVTVISGAIGLIGVVVYSFNVLFSIPLILSYLVLDLVDGDIAREKNQCTYFGSWSDTMLDKLIEASLILSCMFRVYGDNTLQLILAFAMLLNFVCQFSMQIINTTTNSINEFKKKGDKSKSTRNTEDSAKNLLLLIVDNLSIGHSSLILLLLFLPLILNNFLSYSIITVLLLGTFFYLMIAHSRIVQKNDSAYS